MSEKNCKYKHDGDRCWAQKGAPRCYHDTGLEECKMNQDKKTGVWNLYYHYVCSKCGQGIQFPHTLNVSETHPTCPFCGATMTNAEG